MTVAYYVTTARFRTDVQPNGWYPNVGTDQMQTGESYSTVFIDDQDGPPSLYILKMDAPFNRHITFFPTLGSKLGNTVTEAKANIRADARFAALYLRMRAIHKTLSDRGNAVPADAVDLLK